MIDSNPQCEPEEITTMQAILGRRARSVKTKPRRVSRRPPVPFGFGLAVTAATTADEVAAIATFLRQRAADLDLPPVRTSGIPLPGDLAPAYAPSDPVEAEYMQSQWDERFEESSWADYMETKRLAERTAALEQIRREDESERRRLAREYPVDRAGEPTWDSRRRRIVAVEICGVCGVANEDLNDSGLCNACDLRATETSVASTNGTAGFRRTAY